MDAFSAPIGEVSLEDPNWFHDNKLNAGAGSADGIGSISISFACAGLSVKEINIRLIINIFFNIISILVYFRETNLDL